VPVSVTDHGPSPALLRARTGTWYAVPFVSPEMVVLVRVPEWLNDRHVPHLGLDLQVSSAAVQTRYWMA